MNQINEQILRAFCDEKREHQQVIVKPSTGGMVVYSFIKRAADIVLSAVAIVALSPLFAIVALLIRLDDGGPVIYTRMCEGLGGRQYKMYKFRSMKVGADNMISSFSEDQKALYNIGGKLTDDPRITNIGKIIRKTSIDELPQLFSIIKGDMSIIGPRPVISREANAYGEKKELLLSRRAGLTGYWQVHGRKDVYFLSEEAKAMQLYYIEHFGFKLDMELFFQTIIKVMKMQDAR